MTCKEIDNLLPGYEEDLLAPEEKKSVEAHLAACERCRRSLEDLRRAQELVRSLGEVEPPPFFEERDHVPGEAGGRGERGLFRRLFYPLHIKIPLQALATVLVAVLAFQLYQQGDSEMKRVAPLPLPLTAPAKKPAAAEPPVAATAPETVTPVRQPAGNISVTTGRRFSAPRPEGGAKRGGIADSATVREERPTDAIREESRAPETPPPERMMKMTDQKAAMSGMVGEGDGTREGGRSEAPGRAALRQETGGVPAIPAPERRVKARMADAGVAAGEGRPMPAAPAPGEAATSRALERSVVELTIQVADVRLAIQEVEKRLEEAEARIIERRRRGEGEFLRAEMAGGRFELLLGRLGAIGRVNVEKGLPGVTEGTVTVGITIERRP